MNEETNLADDPKLTAYALGELEGAERAEVEAALRDNPEARATVEEIRTVAARLEAALETENVEEGAPREPAAAAIIAGHDPRKLDGGPLHRDPYGGTAKTKLLRFPQFYFLAGGLAAACFAVLVAVYGPEHETHEAAKRYREITLAGADRTAATANPVAGRPGEDEKKAEAAASNALAVPTGLPVQAGQARKQEIAQNTPAVATGGLKTEIYAKAVAGGTMARRASHGPEPMERPVAGAADFAAAGFDRDRFNTEAYAYRAENDFLSVAENPLSTFSADVDTASYANVRRFIEDGRRPPADAVRIEELLNYFPYQYAPPPAGGAPFAASMEVADAPWAAGHRLVRIGLKGREVAPGERGPANLVFLLDVSGSMNEPNKLPLVKESMRMLLGRLQPEDRVAIVVYAGASGLALPSTPVTKAREIADAIDDLRAGGSTNGAMGIQLAYDIAKANFASGGINRVILCTDGDFNVGLTSEGALVRLIREKAGTGVFLTVLGFGMGNYKDATLQQLADAGNGNYGYIDTRREAEKLLVEQVNGTLVTIAKDVKLQVEFNPARVASYRLIGYEKRLLKKEDFNNDKVDAGEIGAGHTVTALYEIVPAGAAAAGQAGTPGVDPLKYATSEPPRPELQVPHARFPAPDLRELLTLKVRYKEPAGETSRKLEFPLTDRGERFAGATGDFKFAAAVAGFGMILRGSPHKGTTTMAEVEKWAEAGASNDPGGYRAEFIALVKRADRIP